LEGVADKDIITRIGDNEIAQGGIDHANEERGREKSDIFVIRGAGEFIRPSRKSIGAS